MGDAAKGIRAFKDGLKDDDKPKNDTVGTISRTEDEKTH